MKNDKPFWLKTTVAATIMIGWAQAWASSPPPWEFEYELENDEAAVEEALERSRRVYEENEDSERAYGILNDLGSVRGHEEVMFWRAWYASDAGLAEEAEAIYRELIGRDPEDPWLYNALGYLLASTSYARLGEAGDLLQRALEMAPDEPDILHSYGYVLEDLGNWVAAEEYYGKAFDLLEEEYDYDIFFDYGGVLLTRRKDLEFDSLLEYMATIEDDEVGGGIFALELFRSIYKNRVSAEMVEFFGEFAAEHPDADAIVPHAFLLHRLGDHAAAKRQLEKVEGLVDENSSSETLLFYGWALQEAGMAKDAERIYRFQLNKEPEDPRHHWALGHLLADDGRKLDEAMEILEEGLALHPGRPELLASYALALHNNGQSAAARVLAEEALSHEYPMEAYIYVTSLVKYGEILLGMGYEDAAVDAWERAWEIDSNHVDVLEAVNRHGLAFEEVDEEDEHRQRVGAVLERAEYIASEVGPEEAYEFLTAVNVLEFSEIILYARASYAELAGLNEETEKLYRMLMVVSPENAFYYDRLGYFLATKSTRLVEAEQILETALELSPENPSVVDSYGWVQYRLGRLEEARSILEKAVGLADLDSEEDIGVNGTILAHYGEVLWESGMHEEALDAWRQGLLLDFEHGDLIDTLTRYADERDIYTLYNSDIADPSPGVLR